MLTLVAAHAPGVHQPLIDKARKNRVTTPMPVVQQPRIDTARLRVDGARTSSPPRMQQPWAPHQLHCLPQQQQWHQRQQRQQLPLQQPPQNDQARGAWPPPHVEGASPQMAQAADARQKARKLQFELRLEMKHMERAMKKMFNEEARLQQRLRTELQRGNSQMSQTLAKSVVRTRRAAARVQKTKASMQVLDLRVTESIASLNARSCVRLSADALRQLGEAVRLPELEQASQELHREAVLCVRVEKAIDEGLGCSGEVEEAADAEVQKLLEELALDHNLQRLAINGKAVSAAAIAPPAAAAFVPQTLVRPACSPGRAALAARWPPARA